MGALDLRRRVDYRTTHSHLRKGASLLRKKEIKMKPNTNKVRVPVTDIEHFPFESLHVDPYWNDLYNPVRYKH